MLISTVPINLVSLSLSFALSLSLTYTHTTDTMPSGKWRQAYNYLGRLMDLLMLSQTLLSFSPFFLLKRSPVLLETFISPTWRLTFPAFALGPVSGYRTVLANETQEDVYWEFLNILVFQYGLDPFFPVPSCILREITQVTAKHSLDARIRSFWFRNQPFKVQVDQPCFSKHVGLL